MNKSKRIILISLVCLSTFCAQTQSASAPNQSPDKMKHSSNEPKNIAGRWELLPGSFSSEWTEEHPETRQANRKPKNGWLTDIRRIGYGHFQQWFPYNNGSWIDLYGTDTMSSGDWNFDEVVEGKKQQIRIHVEATLTKDRLYHRLTTKTIYFPGSGKEKTPILYNEVISTAAYRGPLPQQP
ncbi:MAG TPA: hypothetical protein VFK06_00070 [Candidatus Angelobacter sp.]|nr:hypothetical protein [Candidatus Angelobacter sp.]